VRFFRLRLILALVAGVTLVSLASTYFDVLAHKLVLRQELVRRSKWMALSLQPGFESALASGASGNLHVLVERAKSSTEALGLVVYDAQGKAITGSGPSEILQSLSPGAIQKSIAKGAEVNGFGHTGDRQWLQETLPLHNGNQLIGAMALVADASYIRSDGYDIWRRSFLRITAVLILIILVTGAMVRWFLMRPMVRVAERLRSLRIGHTDEKLGHDGGELEIFSPIVREVQTMAESLIAARAAAATEARLRDAGEHVWTAERLAVHVRDNSGSSRIFVVSNREPYMHIRQGRETVCIVPPSGLVTALEPVLRACDGVWVACGSGDADTANVDAFDRLRVPPDDPRYTLRRVWLSEEEEESYYEGFSNEGLWPLCHIAHTRPIFRASDWECYQRVNERFAAALVEEMKGTTNPIVFVQDYHFALLPRMIKLARPDARVAIFWHIPWPNPESFGICPWQAQLLDGMLGADLIGFHIPLYCNNFLATVDGVIESRTDRELMTVSRHGHLSAVRPYPVSVGIDGASMDRLLIESPPLSPEERQIDRDALLNEFGVRAESLVIGVDRLDYTKGILERLLAIEQLLEAHPWHRERMTLVQIAAPSRTHIPSYAALHRRVEEEVDRINRLYRTEWWKPIVLVYRQASHDEVNLWYRAADVCLVTSLHDGMNLVAKEFVAARSDEDGVLVLSKFAGASIELRDALIVNPYDIAGVSEALHRALEMDVTERRQRMRHMRRQITEFNIYRWAASVLGDLRELRIQPADTADPRSTRAQSESVEPAPHRKLA
jgi:trehalose 6-phosphate synthase